jgi:hypothetical protein
MHQNACGLDREEEDNGANLTRESWATVGHQRGRVPMRGGWEAGLLVQTGLLPRLHAPTRRGGVLVVLRVQREKEKGEIRTDSGRRRRR